MQKLTRTVAKSNCLGLKILLVHLASKDQECNISQCPFSDLAKQHLKMINEQCYEPLKGNWSFEKKLIISIFFVFFRVECLLALATYIVCEFQNLSGKIISSTSVHQKFEFGQKKHVQLKEWLSNLTLKPNS